MKWVDEIEQTLGVTNAGFNLSPRYDQMLSEQSKELKRRAEDIARLIAAVRVATSEIQYAADALSNETGDANDILNALESRMYRTLVKLQSGEFPTGGDKA